MRPLILTVLIAITSPTFLAAQTMPTMPPTTYPEAGTFCGVLTLCPKASKGVDQG